MEGLKLDQWRNNFAAEVTGIQIELDAFFLNKKVEDFYELKIDDISQTLLLEIKNKSELPKEIETRLLNSFEIARPKDSM